MEISTISFLMAVESSRIVSKPGGAFGISFGARVGGCFGSGLWRLSEKYLTSFGEGFRMGLGQGGFVDGL